MFGSWFAGGASWDAWRAVLRAVSRGSSMGSLFVVVSVGAVSFIARPF
jgi:hypothetical protein